VAVSARTGSLLHSKPSSFIGIARENKTLSLKCTSSIPQPTCASRRLTRTTTFELGAHGLSKRERVEVSLFKTPGMIAKTYSEMLSILKGIMDQSGMTSTLRRKKRLKSLVSLPMTG
jgi:hypothetical protein